MKRKIISYLEKAVYLFAAYLLTQVEYIELLLTSYLDANTALFLLGLILTLIREFLKSKDYYTKG